MIVCSVFHFFATLGGHMGSHKTCTSNVHETFINKRRVFIEFPAFPRWCIPLFIAEDPRHIPAGYKEMNGVILK